MQARAFASSMRAVRSGKFESWHVIRRHACRYGYEATCSAGVRHLVRAACATMLHFIYRQPADGRDKAHMRIPFEMSVAVMPTHDARLARHRRRHFRRSSRAAAEPPRRVIILSSVNASPHASSRHAGRAPSMAMRRSQLGRASSALEAWADTPLVLAARFSRIHLWYRARADATLSRRRRATAYCLTIAAALTADSPMKATKNFPIYISGISPRRRRYRRA